MTIQVFCVSHSHGRLRARSIAEPSFLRSINPLNAEFNPIRHLLALVGARHIVHVSRIRVKMSLPLSFSQNEVESHRNTCSLFAYYAMLTGNLLPTFRKSFLPPSSGSRRRLLWLQWRWVRYSPERFDIHQQGSGSHKSHTEMFVWTEFSLWNILYM